MKKFVAKIEVWLDDDKDTVDANGLVNTFVRPSDRTDGPEMFFQIHLPPNDKGNNPDTLAHELGHVVAHIYRTPASYGDDIAGKLAQLLTGSIGGIQRFKSAMKIKLIAEEEAWEIAHKICPSIKAAVEKESLDSYKKAIEEAPVG